MNDKDIPSLVDAFGMVAIASIADAVDKACGKRGYMESTIKPQINDHASAARPQPCWKRRPMSSCHRNMR